LVGNDLTFTGVGNGFNGSVDLSSLVGGTAETSTLTNVNTVGNLIFSHSPDGVVAPTDVFETVVTLVDNADGTVTFTNESGTPVVVDVATPSSDADNLLVKGSDGYLFLDCAAIEANCTVPAELPCGPATGFDGCDPATMTETEDGVYHYVPAGGSEDYPDAYIYRCDGVNRVIRSQAVLNYSEKTIGGQAGRPIALDTALGEQERTLLSHLPVRIVEATAHLSTNNSTGVSTDTVQFVYEFTDDSGNSYADPGFGALTAPCTFAASDTIKAITELTGKLVPPRSTFREAVTQVPAAGASELVVEATFEYINPCSSCPPLFPCSDLTDVRNCVQLRFNRDGAPSETYQLYMTDSCEWASVVGLTLTAGFDFLQVQWGSGTPASFELFGLNSPYDMFGQVLPLNEGTGDGSLDGLNATMTIESCC
jgi:hypothetical protein